MRKLPKILITYFNQYERIGIRDGGKLANNIVQEAAKLGNKSLFAVVVKSRSFTTVSLALRYPEAFLDYPFSEVGFQQEKGSTEISGVTIFNHHIPDSKLQMA